MMTNEERIQTLHARMAGLQQARERRKTGAIGVSCIGLAFCLLLMVFDGGMHAGGAVSLYSGATMLFEGAGPYVLIAIVAFMAGVIVTAALIRNRKKENGTRETATAPARAEMPPEKTDAETAAGAKKKLFLRMNRTEMTRACALLGLYPGDVPVYLHFPEEKTTLLAPRASWCDAGEACLKRLRDEMGPENVVLKGG